MIIVEARRCFQPTYGNTYHSVVVKDTQTGGIKRADFNYGYDEQYLNTAAVLLGMNEAELRRDMRDNRAKYHVVCTDVPRKKDL